VRGAGGLDAIGGDVCAIAGAMLAAPNRMFSTATVKFFMTNPPKRLCGSSMIVDVILPFFHPGDFLTMYRLAGRR
jgi:hypothetical protein